MGKTRLPTHIDIYADKAGLAKDSIILLEQIRTLDKRRLKEKMGHLDEDAMLRVDNAIAVSFGLGTGTQSGAVDAFGHKYLSGTGKALELAVKDKFGCKVRSIELNLPQRCASHLSSKTDLDESVAIGRSAVWYAASGETGKMMIFTRMEGEKYEVGIDSADISGIANAVRSVPRDYINERGNGVTKECLSYIAPLIIGEPNLVFEGGLPKHFVF